MKKLLVIMITLIITFTFTYQPREAKAIGVIGSNALKSAVIGSMERAGITFANKEAKQKAFDAWNMRAYEKWKEDEAAGRNADLWEAFERWTLNPPVVESDPKKPGFGRVLLDSTIFGMAIGIGADIGFAIQDAQANQRYMKYMASAPKSFPGISYNDYFNVTKEYYSSESTYVIAHLLPDGYNIGSQRAPKEYGLAGTYVDISKFEKSNDGKYWILEISFAYISSDGTRKTGTNTIIRPTENIVPKPNLAYELIPGALDVPNINPSPAIAPLVVPNPAIEIIPEVLPPDVPIEITVPLNPENDPFDDGVINDPYTPPDPNPGEDPDKPPGTDPEDDPDKPPGTDPEDDPNKEPGTDPEECPKEPCEETPPKEDEVPPSKTKEELEETGRNWGALVTTKFPFSLPWDFYAILSFLSSSPETPKWKISMDSMFYDDPIEFEINLSFLDPYMPFFRTFIILGFALALVMSTRTLLGGAK